MFRFVVNKWLRSHLGIFVCPQKDNNFFLLKEDISFKTKIYGGPLLRIEISQLTNYFLNRELFYNWH